MSAYIYLVNNLRGLNNNVLYFEKRQVDSNQFVIDATNYNLELIL
jgi:hypothetical protein